MMRDVACDECGEPLTAQSSHDASGLCAACAREADDVRRLGLGRWKAQQRCANCNMPPFEDVVSTTPPVLPTVEELLSDLPPRPDSAVHAAGLASARSALHPDKATSRIVLNAAQLPSPPTRPARPDLIARLNQARREAGPRVMPRR